MTSKTILLLRNIQEMKNSRISKSVNTFTSMLMFFRKKADIVTLFISYFWLTYFFLYKDHFIELSDTIDSWLIYKGFIIYKDYETFHFPLGRLILQPIHIISSWNFAFDPLLGLALGIASLFLIYLIMKNEKNKFATSMALVFFSLYYWFTATGIEYYHEQLSCFLILLAIYFFLKLLTHKQLITNNLFLFCFGLTISMAEMAGQISSISLVLLVLLFFIYFLKNKQAKSFLLLISFFVGLLGPFVYIGLYFIAKHAFDSFFFSNFTYYLSSYSNYEHLKIALLPHSIRFFYLPFIALFIKIIIDLIGKHKPLNQSIILFVLSISTIPFAVFGVFHPHHLTYALPILSITAGYACLTIQETNLIHKIIYRSLATLIIFLLFLTVFPWYQTSLNKKVNFSIKNDLLIDKNNSMFQSVHWIIDNTSPNTKILVVGDPLFYIKSNRLPSIKSANGMEFSWRDYPKVESQISSLDSQYIIVADTYIKRLINNYSEVQKSINYMYQVLEDQYVPQANYNEWHIWKLKPKFR
jgi:hypothetical protein